MKRCILGLLLLLIVSAGAEPSSEQISENRLSEILGTLAIQKNTLYGGRLTMIDVPEDSRSSVHQEFFRLLNALRRLGTRDSVRVVAGLLDDDRYVLEPGNDYTTYTIADKAERELAAIQRENPSIVPGAPSPARPPDPRATRAAWRKWWAENKASYEHSSPATKLPK